MVQCLRPCTSTAGGPAGLIPGQGIKILQAAWHSQKKLKKKTTENNTRVVPPKNSEMHLGKKKKLRSRLLMFLIVTEILYCYQLLKEVSSFLIVGVETYSLPKEWFGICIKMFIVHILTQHSLF